MTAGHLLSARLSVAVLALVGCSGPTNSDATVARESSSSGGLVCAHPLWNLGAVEGGTTYDHAFRLENTLSENIELVGTASTCGCIVTRPTQRTLAGGMYVDLPVSISVPRVPGAVRQRVTVISSEGASRHRLQLEIQAECRVSPALFVLPQRVDFGEVSFPGEERYREFVVGRYDGSPVAFVGVVTTDPAVSLAGEPTPVSSVREGLKIAMKVDAERLPVGPHSCIVTVQTSSAEPYSNIDVPVRIQHRSELQFGIVGSLFLTSCKWGTAMECSVLKASSDHREIRLHACQFEGDPRITASLGNNAAVGTVVLEAADTPVNLSADTSTAQVIRGVLVTSCQKGADGITVERRIPVTMIFN
jgi:hypothetical protein